ncbi:MAG: DNA helicase UvrD [Candidatus Magasanikbacteria bacterium CG10_big_fil_rev_8_21_14_0_10_43_6]|uniref:DNA helicase UvrD n=1 Tax=Candidatus Magasanikbacteria bacterium CG10_big_fil_rev_8_21_14_0_10_43_6 TaxID=1974650 RepID=A0A2M6W1M2_9BACT|nr:MAG: DNA helicase UvrD [Candidatus Magasanikbacteria bacterium CG10_big_fil_rev_8_21_14_0_10_43_6]
MQKILDLHIHSKYSRACSKHLELPTIAQACEIRGIDIVVTGDFTHPRWFEHMKEYLVEDTEGLYKLKSSVSPTRFMIGTEVSCIKKHKGETRRVHNLVFAPNLEVAEAFHRALDERGFNLKADGRPILGMTSKDLLALMLDIDERMVMIPAHAWTPWFAIFGSKSGYDSIEEAFDELSPHIFAIETGLSSDPLMNWHCSMLDHITLISNSDAHSPQKLGREANVMQFEDASFITYKEIMRILREGDKRHFLYTIEFYPEEGKYHIDGHRSCNFSCTPEETKKYGGLCPVCKKPLVIGVMNRVASLADRSDAQAKAVERIPYKSLVPLPEIIADTFGCGVTTKRVATAYELLTAALGSEFYILLDAPLSDIAKAGSKEIADAVRRVRAGDIVIQPGYDGVFGTVKVFETAQDRGQVQQLGLSLE